MLWLAAATPALADVTVHFLDVGQGDSILIETDDGKAVLIDGGPPDAGPRILARLEELEIDRLDLVIASHPHLDHIGGLIDVLQNVEVGAFMDPGIPHTISTYKKMVGLIQSKKIKAAKGRRGRKIKLGKEAVLQVLGPEEPLLSDTRSDLNANSVVVYMSVGEVDFLFLGDSEPDTLERLLNHGLPEAEVLKVAHHGSRWGTSRRLLTAVRPKIAVISCGKHNRFGHPHEKTLAHLADARARVYRTDQSGTIVVTTNGHSLGVHTVPTRNEVQLGASLSQLGGDVMGARVAPGSSGGGKFYASRRSKVYHPAGCAHLKRIKPENLVEFVSRDEAESSGRHPARGCRITKDAADTSGDTTTAAATPKVTATPVAKEAAGTTWVASRNSKVYHRASCPHVKDIAKENLIRFDSREEAEATGRTPAAGCKVEK